MAEPIVTPTLRGYQQKGVAYVQWLSRFPHGGILAFDPGLGKTGTILSALPADTNTILIVAPIIAFGTWIDEVRLWLGEEITIVTDRQSPDVNTRFVLVNPEQVSRLRHLPFDWDLVIVDEIHKYRNRSTKRYSDLEPITRKANRTIGLTGSPIVNGVQDLWTQLHLVAPKVKAFASYHRFVNTWCEQYQGLEGYQRLTGAVRDDTAFRQMLSRYMLRITKEQVAAELPPKIRQALYVDMDERQQRLYTALVDDMVAELPTGEHVIAGNTLAQYTRLRQTLINPILYGGPNVSAASEAVSQSIDLDFDAGTSAIVFTPFAQAIPHIITTFRKRLKNTSIYVLTGAERNRQSVIREFQDQDNHRKILICTHAIATSFTATAASSAYHIGYEWTPEANIQAEDRIHRLSSRNTVHVHYVVHRGTIDEYIMDVLDRKTTYAQLTRQPQSFLYGKDN